MCAPRHSSISTTLLNTSVCIVGRSPSSVPSVLSASHTLGPTASTWTTATHIASHTENSYASQALASEEQALSSTGKCFCALLSTTRRNTQCGPKVLGLIFLKIKETWVKHLFLIQNKLLWLIQAFVWLYSFWIAAKNSSFWTFFNSSVTASWISATSAKWSPF